MSKGAALAAMVEVSVACIPGANLAVEASSFLDGDEGPPSTGQLSLAIDSEAFGHAHFSGRIAKLIDAIESQQDARLSGARRFASRARAARDGIVILPDIEAALNCH